MNDVWSECYHVKEWSIRNFGFLEILPAEVQEAAWHEARCDERFVHFSEITLRRSLVELKLAILMND